MDSSHMGGPGVLQSLSNDLAGAVERAGASVVAVHARRRIPASGVMWRPGVVVATNHTIERDEQIAITLADGRELPATLRGRDPGTDLAVLAVEGEGLTAATSGGADELRVGALVLALGRPGPSVTASLGIISGIGPEWRTWHGGTIDRLVRLDVAIHDGFSGGPLVGASGAVLGIDTSGLSRGAALAIPTATVDRVVEQLLREGRIARGYVGLGLQPVRIPAATVGQHRLPSDVALMVVSVEPGGPADRAGLFLGDVLLAFGGAPLADPSELATLLGPDAVGQTREARVLRAGKLETVPVTVGERPGEGSGEPPAGGRPGERPESGRRARGPRRGGGR